MVSDFTNCSTFVSTDNHFLDTHFFFQYKLSIFYFTIFSDYKTHPPILEENGGASYSPNIAYLAHAGGWGGGGAGFVPYFPPLKRRCILWCGTSYSPKIQYFVVVVLQT